MFSDFVQLKEDRKIFSSKNIQILNYNIFLAQNIIFLSLYSDLNGNPQIIIHCLDFHKIIYNFVIRLNQIRKIVLFWVLKNWEILVYMTSIYCALKTIESKSIKAKTRLDGRKSRRRQQTKVRESICLTDRSPMYWTREQTNNVMMDSSIDFPHIKYHFKALMHIQWISNEFSIILFHFLT